MSNVSDKSFIYRSYPKLAYGSIPAWPIVNGGHISDIAIIATVVVDLSDAKII